MKKSILFLIAVFAALFSAKAQVFEQGALALKAQTSGLSLSVYSDGDDYSSVSFDLYGSGMYFLTERFALTADLGLYAYTSSSSDDVSTKLSLGAGARFYFVGGFYGGASLLASKSGDYDPTGTLKLEGGYTFFINDNFFFEPALVLKKDFDFDGDVSKGMYATISVGIGVTF